MNFLVNALNKYNYNLLHTKKLAKRIDPTMEIISTVWMIGNSNTGTFMIDSDYQVTIAVDIDDENQQLQVTKNVCCK